MPSKSMKRRRGFNKRRRNNRYAPIYKQLNNALVGFPNQRVVRMRYFTQTALDPSTGSLAKHNFRANSIFDPDQTGIGHQPLAHDIWNNFYNHYVVLGSKITVMFTQNEYPSIQDNTSAVGIYLSDDTTTPTTVQNMVEQGNSKWKYLNDVYNGNSPSHKYITSTYSAKRFFNVKDVKDNVTRIGASFGSNPDDEAIFTIWAGGLDALDNPLAIKCGVTIDYIVLMSEPRALDES